MKKGTANEKLKAIETSIDKEFANKKQEENKGGKMDVQQNSRSEPNKIQD